MSLHLSPRIQSCSKRSEQKPLVPGTLLAVVVHTKDPRLQRGKHAALKNGIYQSWQCWLRYVSYLCPEVVISIPGRMGQGQHKCLLQKESAARISAERNIIMFFTTWPSPNPPSKKQLLSSGKTPCNPLAWHPPPPSLPPRGLLQWKRGGRWCCSSDTVWSLFSCLSAPCLLWMKHCRCEVRIKERPGTGAAVLEGS